MAKKKEKELNQNEITSKALDLIGRCDAFVLFAKRGDDLYEMGIVPERSEKGEPILGPMSEVVSRAGMRMRAKGLALAVGRAVEKAAKESPKKKPKPAAKAAEPTSKSSVTHGTAKKTPSKKAAK